MKVCKPIFGVDPSKPVTPLAVRDAMVDCFIQAHCSDAELEGDRETAEKYCRRIVQKAFEDTDGDFNNPTKESIQAALKNLAEFAKKFRDQETVRKHYRQIMELAEKLK